MTEFDNLLDELISEYSLKDEKRLARLEESILLDYQFLRVPVEHYWNLTLSRHRLCRSGIMDIFKEFKQFVASAGSGDVSKHDCIEYLSSAVQKLKKLKEKVQEANVLEEQKDVSIWVRLNHLEEAHTESIIRWRYVVEYRVIIDYLLHSGFYKTAEKLAERLGLQDVVDIDIFKAKKIKREIRTKNFAPVIAWCEDNDLKSPKFKCVLKLWVRFMELLTARNKVGAIEYARRLLVPLIVDKLTEDFENVIETLERPPGYQKNIWDMIEIVFDREFFASNGMLAMPLLNIYLQAGLSALKTTACGQEDCPVEDPLSQEDFRKLTMNLPIRIPRFSEIYCCINQEIMHKDDIILALPNGHVYSEKGLKKMAEHNSGEITCPRTKFVCKFNELKRLYIVNICD